MDQFKIIRRIGSGSFGVALLVQKNGLENNKQFVIKQINLSGMTQKEIQEARHEVAVLQTLSGGNSFIIGYYEAFVEGKRLNIVLDYADGGDLSDYIANTKRNRRTISERVVLKWFVQLCSALKYIHGRKILHRDLKTQNIFLATVSNEKDFSVKLGDFGIAKILQSTSECANTIIGTPYYLSPELCEDRPYNEKSDVWALGCVLYEMCTLNHAFDGKSMCALVLKILKGKYPPIQIGGRSGYSAEFALLIDQMLQYDASKRPSVAKMLESDFLQSYIHDYEKTERLNVHTFIRSASDRNMNGMRTRERQLQKESREKAIKALSPDINAIRKHQRQLSAEFQESRKIRNGEKYTNYKKNVGDYHFRKQGWVGGQQGKSAVRHTRFLYGQNSRRRRSRAPAYQSHAQKNANRAGRIRAREIQAKALASKIINNHKKPIGSHVNRGQGRLEIESRIAREVYEKEMRLRDEKKKLKSHYKTKRKTSQEMARLHEKQLKKQIKNAKPTINIKELREKARKARDEGTDDNWKFDGCVVPLNYKNLTPRNQSDRPTENEISDSMKKTEKDTFDNSFLEESIRLNLDDAYERQSREDDDGFDPAADTQVLSNEGGMPWEDNTSLNHFGDDERYLSDIAEAHDFTLTWQQSDEFSKKLKACDDIEALKVTNDIERSQSPAGEVASLFSSSEFAELKSPSPTEQNKYRSAKVEKLRVECENILGDTIFIKAYRFVSASLSAFNMDDDLKMEEDFHLLVSTLDLTDEEKSIALAKIQLLLLLEEKLNEQINHEKHSFEKREPTIHQNKGGGYSYTLNL